MHSAITFNSRRHDVKPVERFDTTNKDICLPVTSLKDNTTRSIDDVFFFFFFLFYFDVRRCTNLVGLSSSKKSLK